MSRRTLLRCSGQVEPVPCAPCDEVSGQTHRSLTVPMCHQLVYGINVLTRDRASRATRTDCGTPDHAMANRWFFTALTLVAALATAVTYGLGGNLVITGAISRTTLMATIAGSMLSAPNLASVGLLCTVSTSPMMKAVMATRGSER